MTLQKQQNRYQEILSDPTRLATIHDLDLTDSPAEEVFDRLTRLASKLIPSPVALVSIVDDERQFFKSLVGLAEPWASMRQTPLTHSFCQHVVVSGESLIVENAPEHPLVKDNLAIPDLGVISYLGMPLTTQSGQTLGSFCVIDTEARQWTDDDINTVRELARSVMTEIELRHEVKVLKKTESQLRHREQQFRSLVETAPAAIVVINKDGEIVLANERVETLFNYHQDDLIGERVEVLLPEPLKDIHKTHRSGFFSKPEARAMGTGRELLGRRKNGSVFPIEIGLSYTETDEGILALAFITDITERQQLHNKLEQSNRDLADFAYIVSHDLKAPLRGISSIADWLSTDYVEVLDDDGQELLTLLQRRVGRLQNLIEGVLRYSRVGRIEDGWENVDLQKLVDNIIMSLAPPDHIEIIINDPLPTVYGGHVRLEQVFQNLLSNAIKYMDKPEGHIEISSKLIDGIWEFRVKDNGPGIEERYFTKIFQMFQTLNARDEFESTGIGLTIVKKIVEMHGGTVLIQSVVGQGTEFIFTIPEAGGQG